MPLAWRFVLHDYQKARVETFIHPEADALGKGWNITLFHYRNHGADYGRVLVGMQVPAGEKKKFRAFLKELGYSHWDETQNPAYNLFLG